MYHIRKATINDAETIRDLAIETWGDAYSAILARWQLDYMLDCIYSLDNLSAQIKNNTQTYLLLVEDDEPVAFAAYSPREENAEIYKLHKLYCLPKTQGKGYGRI